MNINIDKKIIVGLSGLAIASPQAAEITWGTPAEVTQATDISNPAGSTVHVAADFNNATGYAAGDDHLINGISFALTPNAGNENLTTSMANGPTYGTTFFPGVTDDLDLDGLLDSHSYTAGNPSEVTLTFNKLIPGREYQVQLIGVADGRDCCAGRIYEPDDGQGNYNTSIQMNRGGYFGVLGTFTADTREQNIMWRSLGGVSGTNNDAGFSGLVLLELERTVDFDNDGLFDAWEIVYGLDPNTNDSDGDLILDGDEDEDEDTLSNLEEQELGTDITKDDTDGDGYLDGVETNTGTWISVDDTGTDPLNNDSDGDGLLDGVENPDLAYVDATQTGSDPNLVDTDSDNLPDALEVSLDLNPNNVDTDNNGTNDDEEDFDNDGSTNGNELTLGTDPTNEDTDNDGFKDGVETNTGTWVSAGDTGTDPLNEDSDGDTILDGVENHDLSYNAADPTGQPGTDPNLDDTDGDLRSDNYELALGSDPTDANSFTELAEITFLPTLAGGDLTDPEDDGIDTENTAGSNFNWVSITSSGKSFFSDATAGGVNEGAFDIFDNKVGPGEAKWCCDNAPQDVTVEFEEPVSLTHFTITSGNDVAGRDPIDWQIQGSDDGITFTPIYTNVGSSIWTARNQTALVTLPSPAEPYKFIRYSVTATEIGAHQLNEIEYFGEVGSTPLDITDIIYNEETDTITLTWTSKPNSTYTIFANEDLLSFDADINDSVPSGGETTTLTFPNPNPGARRQFFQVMEN